MKSYLISILMFSLISSSQLGIPFYGVSGTENLSDAQLSALEAGDVVFFQSEKNGDGSGVENIAKFVEVAALFDAEAGKIYEALTAVERQYEYVPNMKESELISFNDSGKTVLFKYKMFFSFYCQVVHKFFPEERIIKWELDSLYDNDVEQLTGFWQLFPYGDGSRTLVRYGNCLQVSGIPSFVQDMFKNSGVKENMETVRNWIECG